jgi:hypothetical protein
MKKNTKSSKFLSEFYNYIKMMPQYFAPEIPMFFEPMLKSWKIFVFSLRQSGDGYPRFFNAMVANI